MCIICVSPKGTRQPNYTTLRTMFYRNPHGAGFMFARDGKVHIHKGFMDFADYVAAIKREHFTAKDPVVYHFRISTQAGVQPEMTHPFPLSNRPCYMKALDLTCACGIVHNGVIRLTADPTNTEFSDTALFVTQYLSHILIAPEDLKDQDVLDTIEFLAGSKLAIMDGSGYIATVGEFINDRGLLFSNRSFEAVKHAS